MSVPQLPWITPDMLGINWKPEGKHNRIATPYFSITQDEFTCKLIGGDTSLCGINYSQVYSPGQESNAATCDLWMTHYFIFNDYVLAALEKYHTYHRLNKEPYRPATEEYLVHKDDYGFYVMRYYRIGCSHPNLQHKNPVMFTHIYDCPDCGYHTEHDSSG